jgi:hypothetical protein
MPVPARNATSRLDQLISECKRLQCVIDDAAQTLERAADALHAETEGVSVTQHKPLQELQRAGKLRQALSLLESLAQNPEYMEAALELAAGASLEIVAKCLPRTGGHGPG